MNEFDCCSKFQSEKACEENVENLDMTSEILKIVKIIQRYILKDFFIKIRTKHSSNALLSLVRIFMNKFLLT